MTVLHCDKIERRAANIAIPFRRRTSKNSSILKRIGIFQRFPGDLPSRKYAVLGRKFAFSATWNSGGAFGAVYGYEHVLRVY